MKKTIMIMSATLVLALGIGFVIGAVNDAESTVGAVGQYTTPATTAVAAEGGNVSEVNVTSNAATAKWQGFWGNVSGGLRLGDGSNVFYDWNTIPLLAVYAGLSNDIDFANVDNVNHTTTPDLEALDTAFSFTSTDPDSINSTFSGGSCTAGSIFSTAAGVSAFDNGGSAGSWETCAGQDTGGTLTDTVFGTQIIEAGAQAYNGDTVQYQLMVPVEAAGSTYYMYLEI